MSFIDLGGPGCVRMNYISPEEGIAINVSYGASLLHSETVRGPDPAPTCLNIFSQIAQMCARFSELLPTDDGLRGCINLEPMLLGSVRTKISYRFQLNDIINFSHNWNCQLVALKWDQTGWR